MNYHKLNLESLHNFAYVCTVNRLSITLKNEFMNEVINRHFSHLTEPLELLGVVYPAPISKPLTIDKVKVHAEKLNNCNSNHAKEIAGRIFKILNDCK